MAEITLYKNRTNKIKVNLGIDVSGDTFTTQIAEKANTTSPRIATGSVVFDTTGTDGKLVVTFENENLASVAVKSGFMDLKRVSGGEPLPVFPPVKVNFLDVVTE